MPTVINLRDAKANLSRILEDVAAGAEVVIAKAGKPVARLVPIVSASKPKQLGLLKGRIRVAEDFNAPLPSERLADFEGL